MAKSIAQAEAELRTAALEYAAAEAKYMQACRAEPGFFDDYLNGARTFDYEKASEGWQMACRASNAARDLLAERAQDLAAAIAAERRAEAL